MYSIFAVVDVLMRQVVASVMEQVVVQQSCAINCCCRHCPPCDDYLVVLPSPDCLHCSCLFKAVKAPVLLLQCSSTYGVDSRGFCAL